MYNSQEEENCSKAGGKDCQLVKNALPVHPSMKKKDPRYFDRLNIYSFFSDHSVFFITQHFQCISQDNRMHFS